MVPQVQAKCELADNTLGTEGEDCSSIVINGEDAAANGYPDVEVKHTLQLCNYNDGTTNRIRMVAEPRRAKLEFLYPVVTAATKTQVKIVDASYNGQLLAPKDCFEETGFKTLTTNKPKHFMMAILQGPQETQGGTFIPGGYCYAYSYNKIDFKFIYPSLGECEMSVSTFPLLH